MHTPSDFLLLSFALYSILVACLALAALIRAGSHPLAAILPLVLWMGLTSALAKAGVLLSFESFPPPAMQVILVGFLSTVLLASSKWSVGWLERWSLAGLIGFQAFRLPLEMIMHRAATERVMPSQMTFTGRNFDILTGILAIPLAIATARDLKMGPALAWAWNVLGFALLVNVVRVAILSFPGPMRTFMQEPSNEWVAHAPFIWLPTVFVPLALAGHILVTRKLLAKR